MAKGTSKRELTQWQRDDARRLLALWGERPAPRLNQTEFGERYGIGSQGMVWQYLHAHRALNAKAASGFAAGLNCQVSDFSPRLAKDISRMAETELRGSFEGFTKIDRYRVQFAAGAGNDHEVIEAEPQLAFRMDWLQKKGWHPLSLKVFYADGRSMEPRIQDGDVLLVDTADRKIRDGKVYALLHSGRARVKRLFMRVDGALRICSDNSGPEFAEELVPKELLEHVQVIGRVVWIGGQA